MSSQEGKKLFGKRARNDAYKAMLASMNEEENTFEDLPEWVRKSNPVPPDTFGGSSKRSKKVSKNGRKTKSKKYKRRSKSIKTKRSKKN